MINLADHLILQDEPLLNALDKLNNVPMNLTLFVLDDVGKVVGTLTDGDVRRGLIAGKKVTDSIGDFMIRDFHFLTKDTLQIGRIKEIKLKGIKLLPVLDQDQKIINVLNFNLLETILPVEAILMAGGRGERLRPLTDSLPKPLLPLGDKTIIDYNIDILRKYGIEKITISINYLGSKLVEHFSKAEYENLNISFISEDDPLGTIGALKKIKSFTEDNILLMNSDLFTNIDLEEFYLHFLDSNAKLTVASVPYNISVPYAVLDLSEDEIISFKEKPTMTYYSNAGIYLFKKDIIDYIPEDTRFHATDLMEKLIRIGDKITYFPIIGYWIDIGKPEDYKKAQEFIKFLKY